MSAEWPRAFADQPLCGQLKQTPEDFQVDEILGFEPSGDGEHLLVLIEKRDCNTVDVAAQLSKRLSLHPRLVNWSGLKDRRALTRQWFSLHLPGRADPALDQLQGEHFRALTLQRNRRKLQRGSHRGNRFTLRLNEVEGDRSAVEQRLRDIREQGVPNYFGEQRFGWERGNVEAARTWFAQGRPRVSRQRQSLLLSSARAWVFNQVLAARVEQGVWRTGLPGECYMLDGSASLFLDDGTATLADRLAVGDIHPTGPLPGKPARGLQPLGDAAVWEQARLAEEAVLVRGLIDADVEAARRSLRMRPQDLSWVWADDSLQLSFSLPRGCFATSLVREFCAITTTDRATGVM